MGTWLADGVPVVTPAEPDGVVGCDGEVAGVTVPHAAHMAATKPQART
jgi:hypothetical protein